MRASSSAITRSTAASGSKPPAPRIAQIALRLGADDIDGTIVKERIYHDAGAATNQGFRRGELLELIRRAGREPVERDTLYRPVERTETTFSVLT